MSQAASSSVIDGTLDKISSLSSVMYVCRGQPASYLSAVTMGSQALASITVSAGLFTKSDYTSGRNLAFASVAGSVTATGTADHVVFVEAGTSTMHFINTATAQSLTAANSLTVAGFNVRVSNPGQ